MQPYALPIFRRPLDRFFRQFHKEPAHKGRFPFRRERRISKPPHDPGPVAGLLLNLSYRRRTRGLPRFDMPLEQYPLGPVTAGLHQHEFRGRSLAAIHDTTGVGEAVTAQYGSCGFGPHCFQGYHEPVCLLGSFKALIDVTPHGWQNGDTGNGGRTPTGSDSIKHHEYSQHNDKAAKELGVCLESLHHQQVID